MLSKRIQNCLLLATLSLLLCAASNLQAQSLEGQLAGTAETLGKAIKGKGFESVLIRINDADTISTSAPALIQEVLGSSLIKLGIQVRAAQAPVALKGELKTKLVKDQETDKVSAVVLTIRFDVVILGEDNQLTIETSELKVADRGEVARLLGLPIDASPGRPSVSQQTADALTTTPDQPEPVDDIAMAHEDGEFGLQLIRNGKPVPAKKIEGLTFAELAEGDECEIKLINNADFEVAVRLTLDGIDCFWFSEKKQSLWLIGPHETLVVRGWQLDDQNARKFSVVPIKESVAFQAGSPGKIGTIAAAFFRSYDPAKGEVCPKSDAPESATKGIGIGAGDGFANPVKSVKREIGKLRSLVPIRYTKP